MTSLNMLVQESIQNANNKVDLLENTPIFAFDYYNPGEGLDADSAAVADDDMPSEDTILGSIPIPNDNCCYIFEHKNYGGSRTEVCHNGSAVTNHLYDGPWDFNDKASSYTCGRDTIFTMCDNEMWRCKHKNISSGLVRNPNIGEWMEDKLTSIKIEPYNHKNNGGANIFEDYYCAG